MAKSKGLYLTNGVKTVSAWDLDSDVGWTVHSGESNNAKEPGLREFYQRVPWLFRGVDAIKSAVSAMPFAITRGDTEIDTSKDYANTVGFWPDPRLTLGKVAESLTLVNAAYLFNASNRFQVTKELKYLAPKSIVKINFDPDRGLVSFERKLQDNLVPQVYAVDEKGNCPIIYFWRSDYQTEIGPTPESSPAAAALMAAGVLYSKDRFIADFFKRGAIKVTILAADTNDQAEAERLKTWWRDVIGGVKNAWTAFVTRAKQIVPTVIGGGLEQLEDGGSLTDKAREDIATALGIPQTKLFSNAANYATSQNDNLMFYNETVIPLCMLIQDVLNEQVFTPQGYTFKFQPETLDIFQEDEVQRAQSLNTVMDFLAKCPTFELFEALSADLGYEWSDKTLAGVKAYYAKKEERAAAMDANLNKPPTPPEPPQNNPAQSGQTDQNAQADNNPQQPVTANERRAILSSWKRKALNALRRGEAANVEFEAAAIPASWVTAIHYELEEATTAEQVKAVFDGYTREEAATPEDMAALKEAVSLVKQLEAV